MPAGDDRPVGRVRARGRTSLIIAAAAVLGIVGGTAVGYTVQAERPPTPLPALAQDGLVYPAKSLPKGKEPEPLSAKDDRRFRTEGDLRELLLTKPAGARDSGELWLDDGWVDLASYALEFDSESHMFESLALDEFRRAAGAAWEQGADRSTTIRLVQFRPSSVAGAVEHVRGQLAYMPYEKDGAGNEGDPLKGSGNGRYYVYKPDLKAGYLPSYQARAIFQRGDIFVDINIFDTKPISRSDIRVLAERQLERL
ncbi:hypothetical protein [Streptomyces sp. ISL-100]|uniref:hypothetical protein n=1 Tax=Streptomyces sp. ISL-100 TaxID=2819173 RepID=UPI0027E3BA97|nr:hypothetical protein [Streptomyces sp. ISL-100]